MTQKRSMMGPGQTEQQASEPEPEVKEGRERAAAAVVAVQRKKGVQLVMEWRRPLFGTGNEV